MSSLKVAAREFEITPAVDGVTDVRHGGKAAEVAGGLKTTVFLFQDGEELLCLVTTHFGPSFPVNFSDFVRAELASELGIPVSRVLLFTSHNHTSSALAANGVLTYNAYEHPAPEVELLPVGVEWLGELRSALCSLPAKLESVTVWHACGKEDRITYNRKGHHPDGTTYLMREEDRRKLGDDFQGDIDTETPLVLFRNQSGKTVAALAQFTGHPVTAFHPENTVIFGEWSQVACDILSSELNAPVGFLQGCAGDINSKEMFTGGVKRSQQFGEMLGASYLAALPTARPSATNGFDASVFPVAVPLSELPPVAELESELEEIEDFISRAESGDEDTMLCVGQNFSTGLSPAYRGWLASLIRPWNEWALAKHASGETVAPFQEFEIAVLRFGDVGIVGLPCEPFQNIGRHIRSGSAFPLTIPCGYMNLNHGYVPDSENVGDNEYMSSHHRYTKFRAPFQRPAGDALAEAGIGKLNEFAKRHA